MENKIKLFIIDDRDLIRNSIKMYLHEMQDMEIIGDASNGEEALEKLKVLSPDVILTDINMPQLNGFELVAWIKSNKPKTRVLVMSVDNSDYSVMKMCKLGAYGYFLKDDGLSKLPGAIREIAGGWYFLSDAIRYSVFTKEYFIKTFLLPGIADHRRNSMKII